MARATTIQALRNRGISKKTAEILADAGFTLEKLAASKPERLAKFIPKKEAESPQETRHRPRGGETCPEAREGGQARSPREEALGEGHGGGAGSAPHNSREGTAAHLGRAGDHGRVEGDRPVAPPVRRDGAN